jgi:hypothetical protein
MNINKYQLEVEMDGIGQHVHETLVQCMECGEIEYYHIDHVWMDNKIIGMACICDKCIAIMAFWLHGHDMGAIQCDSLAIWVTSPKHGNKWLEWCDCHGGWMIGHEIGKTIANSMGIGS